MPTGSVKCRMCGFSFEGQLGEESQQRPSGRVRQRTVSKSREEILAALEQAELGGKPREESVSATVRSEAAAWDVPASVPPPPIAEVPVANFSEPVVEKAGSESAFEPFSDPVPEAPVEPEPEPVPVAEAAPVEPEPEPVPIAEAAPVEPEPEPVPVAEAAPVEAEPEPVPVAEAAPVEAEPEPVPVAEAAPVEAEPEPVPVAEAAPVEPEPEPVPVAEALPEESPAKADTAVAQAAKEEVQPPKQFSGKGFKLKSGAAGISLKSRDHAPERKPEASKVAASEIKEKVKSAESDGVQKHSQSDSGSTQVGDGGSFGDKRHKQGFKAQKGENRPMIGDQSLIGWLVSFNDKNGSSIELRGKKFFVSSERIRGNDLVLDDSSVSAPHCMVNLSGSGTLQLQDLLSDNGVHLRKGGNSEFTRIDMGTVESGDTIKFGTAEYLVVLLPEH